MTSNRSRSIDRRAGFSLVELMVAVVVMGIITTQLLLSFGRQHSTAVGQERLVETQDEARILIDMIVADLRMGGFMVPTFASIGSIDGGTAGSDVLCMSDSSVVDETTLGGASTRFPGAQLSATASGAVTSVSVPAASRDIDADGDVDFTVGQGILIGTGSRVHCAVITAMNSTSIDFAPATPGTFSATSDDVAVPAIVYQVNGTQLTRNSVVLSDQIEDIQIQFGVDVDANGTVEGAEFPLNEMTNQDFDRLELARVTLTARDLRATEQWAGSRPAAANRLAGGADNFKRRRLTGDALLRNLQ